MKKYSYIPTDANIETVLNEFSNRLIYNEFKENDGSLSFNRFAEKLKYTDIQNWADNGIEVNGIPFYLEISPATLNANTPASFPNREVTEGDEENPTTRILKVSEYFRNWELQGRAFIQLAKNPKSADNNLSIDDFPSSLEINTVLATFGGAIIEKYSEAEAKAVFEELKEVE